MGYTPTEWHTGDTITEEKLNNMEAGIADGGLPKSTQILSIEPGTAMIFNGTEWTQQSGYGYVTAGQTISWDGDGTGRDSFLDIDTTFYKVSDAIIEDFSAWTASVDGETQTIHQIDGTNCVGAVLVPSGMMVLSLSDTSATIDGDSITAPSVGTYAFAPITLQRPGEVQVFDDKFMPDPANVFDVNDAPTLSEIAEAYNKYGAVYLRIDQNTFGTGVPIFSSSEIIRFDFFTRGYSFAGESGNSSITLTLRFYADRTGLTEYSGSPAYKISLTWAGK